MAVGDRARGTAAAPLHVHHRANTTDDDSGWQ